MTDRKAWEGHAPGPWTVFVDDDGSREIIADKVGEAVCRLMSWTEKVDRADAALIAAAPTLAARVEELEAERDRLRNRLALIIDIINDSEHEDEILTAAEGDRICRIVYGRHDDETARAALKGEGE